MSFLFNCLFFGNRSFDDLFLKICIFSRDEDSRMCLLRGGSRWRVGG